MPVKLVQNHVFGSHDPSRRSKQRHVPATGKCVLLEGIGFQQPEVNLQRRLFVDRVELMWWCKGSSNRIDLNEEAIAEGRCELFDTGRLQDEDKIQNVRRPRDTPVIARHGTDEHIRNAQPVQPIETVHEQFSLGSHW